MDIARHCRVPLDRDHREAIKPHWDHNEMQCIGETASTPSASIGAVSKVLNVTFEVLGFFKASTVNPGKATNSRIQCFGCGEASHKQADCKKAGTGALFGEYEDVEIGEIPTFDDYVGGENKNWWKEILGRF
ncbi:Zinc finger, CCHC-type [Trema orientale]|uniref:Zinc finger, CCHC-type n=1 Tax=Trema orientale TaxID=63057 RepID=A0A2P5CXR1_TREOI|nr:Zinc finger, CCHC-type [Trema orientale]